jgi:glycosyltransferase involved in cell wall biosynthesis
VRILVDYRPALRERSGVGEYLHRLISALASGPGRRDDIVLFSSSFKDRLRRDVIAGATVADRRVPVRVLNRLWHQAGWPPVELLVKGPFDVVHSPHPLMLPSRSAARVVTIHDLDFLSHPERTAGEVYRDYPKLVRDHAHLADHIVVISAFTGGEVHQRLDVPRSSITVCRAGAPDWKPRTALPPEGPILFVGTLEPRKNVTGLFDAYERLLTLGRNVPELILAGRAAPAAAPWLQRLSKPPLAGRVRHLGYVTDAQRKILYERARLLVLPSYNEGFGLPALEAMTIGVPVVASNRGAIPEVLGDAGIMVEPDDSDGLAAAMERLLFDTTAARRAAAQGVRRSLTFKWEASADALRAAYDRAVHLHRGRQAAFARLR